ncbi:hypothetical protein N7468_009268 [Penicillium chermesinum]|uniref:Uncharacterized protein n=1 Tax=Penicillium chermesinum TaxID=63820 RepID=A0A9W9NHD8_9EURO|nr:uncharacterized protein N7468_009268 [Penicillium chermesinum]KAJ5220064.1 hypothetical protein N7468_009268 [Penicillium chermesinum]
MKPSVSHSSILVTVSTGRVAPPRSDPGKDRKSRHSPKSMLHGRWSQVQWSLLVYEQNTALQPSIRLEAWIAVWSVTESISDIPR